MNLNIDRSHFLQNNSNLALRLFYFFLKDSRSVHYKIWQKELFFLYDLDGEISSNPLNPIHTLDL